MRSLPSATHVLAVALTLVVSVAALLDARAPTARERFDSAQQRAAEVRAAIERVAPGAASDEIDRVVRPARRLLLDYEAVARRFPTSGYSDNALLEAAALSQALYARFGRAADRVAATKYYDWLIREYPASSLGRPARASVRALDTLVPASRLEAEKVVARKSAPAAMVARASTPPVRPQPTPRPSSPIAAVPTPEAAPVTAVTAPVSAPSAASPTGGASGIATLRAVERTVMDQTVRITLALDRETPFTHEVLAGPPRAFVDLFGATTSDALDDTALRFEGDAVRQVRIGRRSGAVRVVLDLEGMNPVSVFTLYNPYRVVIDTERSATARARTVVALTAGAPASMTPPTAASVPVAAPSVALGSAAPAASAAPAVVPVAIETPLPVQPVDERLVDVTPVERPPSPADDALPPLPGIPTAAARAIDQGLTAVPATSVVATAVAASRSPSMPVVLPPATPAPSVPSAPAPRRAATLPRPAATLPTAPAVEVPLAATVSPAPAAPAVNGDGNFSLARQLGLGVSRVVIDAGHGGHDPGTPTSGTSEAKLVLDVALRLEKLLLQEGFDVVMTRRTDVFIPLEERPAIANRAGADLFVSIHANSGRDAKARGIETYYLSFASNPEAEAVAARENSTSSGGMHNLPSIVRAIALNNKLDESRDLAQMVQRSLATRLAKSNVGLRSRGVKKAPFVVLIGAQMPSILAEIGFVTNKQEVALIKTPAYRQKIAESLEAAVLQYQRALKRQTSVATR